MLSLSLSRSMFACFFLGGGVMSDRTGCTLLMSYKKMQQRIAKVMEIYKPSLHTVFPLESSLDFIVHLENNPLNESCSCSWPFFFSLMSQISTDTCKVLSKKTLLSYQHDIRFILKCCGIFFSFQIQHPPARQHF